MAGENVISSKLEHASEVFISAVVLGELFFGAAKSRRPSENAARVQEFASGRSIISCDLRVAREYGQLKQGLREKGRPLPENDIWIAATAKAYKLILVTRDQHFQQFGELQVEEW